MIEQTLGVRWLEEQKSKGFFPILGQRLGLLETSLKEFTNVRGFEEWKKNAINNIRDIDSYEFEITESLNIARNADAVEIYPSVDNDPDQPRLSELQITRKGKLFYVEMVKLRSLKGSPRNKVEKLIKKARRQIPNTSSGYLFIDISDVLLDEIYDVGSRTFGVLSHAKILLDEVSQFFKGKNTRILGMVFVENMIGLDANNLCSLESCYTIKHNPKNKLNLSDEESAKLLLFVDITPHLELIC